MIILKQKYYHTNYETYANIVFILICLEATEVSDLSTKTYFQNSYYIIL